MLVFIQKEKKEQKKSKKIFTRKFLIDNKIKEREKEAISCESIEAEIREATKRKIHNQTAIDGRHFMCYLNK